MTLAEVILGLVTLQRLGELVLSKRNTDRLRARGAHEVAPGHYPLIVALHAAWLAGLWLLVAWRAPDTEVSWPWLGVFVVLQALRVWVIATLGPRWTTRIIVLPGAPLVSGGRTASCRIPTTGSSPPRSWCCPLSSGWSGTASPSRC